MTAVRRPVRLFLLRNRAYVVLGVAAAAAGCAGAVLLLLGDRQVGAVVILAAGLPLTIGAILPGRRRHQVLRECAVVLDRAVVDDARNGLRDLETWLRETRR